MWLDILLSSKKAVVGAVVAFVASSLAAHGVDLSLPASEVLQNVAAGLVAGVAVWLTKNKKL